MIKSSLELIYENAKLTNQNIFSYFESIQTRIAHIVSYLSILAGIYLSILTFINDPDEPLLYLPFGIGIIIALSGIVIGLIGLYPTKFQAAIYSEDLYSLRDENVDKTMDTICQTLMIMNRKNIKIVSTKGLISETIIFLAIFSILEVLVGSLWDIFNWPYIEYAVTLILVALIFIIIVNLYLNIKKS